MLVKPIAYYLNMTDFVMSSSEKSMSLKLLVLQLAFQLLSFRHLAHRPVEVVLVDSVSVVFNGKQTTVFVVRIINRKQKSRNEITYASVTTLRRSAPLRPSLIFTTLSKSISPSSWTVLEWIFKISKRPTSLGRGISIFRSKRPARNRAGSSVSGLFVAMMIFVFPR